MRYTVPEIIGELNMLAEQHKEEQLTFHVRVEQKGHMWQIVGIVEDARGLTLNDMEYAKGRSRMTAQGHADVLLNAVRRNVRNIKLKPTVWT